jgi:hypothetical protein
MVAVNVQGHRFLIDDEDVYFVCSRRWWVKLGGRSSNRYVYTSRGGRNYYLHRLLMGAAPGQLVDHASRDTLDNRRSNLRFATASQSVANTRQRVGVSGFRGVIRTSNGGKWEATIGVVGPDGRRSTKKLGRFVNPADAALVYDRAARGKYGEFAVLNFPEAAR